MHTNEGRGKSISHILPEMTVLNHSVQFSPSVVSDSATPAHQAPCPSPTPGVHPNPCPLCRWCHPTISSSVVPFSSCLQSFQHQGFFQWVSSSHQVLALQLQYQSFQWIFRTDFLAVQGTLKSLLQHTAQKHQFFGIQLSLWSNSHIHTWPQEKP